MTRKDVKYLIEQQPANDNYWAVFYVVIDRETGEELTNRTALGRFNNEYAAIQFLNLARAA